MTHLWRRLKALEKARQAQHHRTWTLEDLCRAIWQQDQEAFREMAEHSTYNFFIRQFEYEEAERGR